MEQHASNSEIIIGLVTPVGINYDDVKTRFSAYFQQFNYDLNWLHLSKVVEQEFKKQFPEESESSRLSDAMTFGNNLRKQTCRADIFALIAIKAILGIRNIDKKSQTTSPLGRKAHVIRSLKHPDEVETLRAAYGSGFILIGITASEDTKVKYLLNQKGIKSENEARALIERDDRENDLSSEYGSLGQSTRDVFQLSDAFLSLDSTQEFEDQLLRILEILFSKPVEPPSLQEYSMFMAYAASLRSADLSRQVGAIIVNVEGDVISTGANDVPKASGGQYWPGKEDQRDHVLGYDSNEREKNEIVLNVLKQFNQYDDKLDEQANIDSAKKKLKDTGLLDITEYGRAVHAEMEALLTASRNGVAVRGGILFTTTFPCHNCTKHLITAGIKEVIYIEPYPKSFATKLHKDSIVVGNKISDKDTRITFKQFVGIGPRKFIDLFSMKLGDGRKLKRKEKGNLLEWDRPSSEIRVPMFPLSYLEREVILNKELEELIHNYKENQNG